ncbi:serine hydrolase domain-containing protein [Kordia jejudonensis]|uniref:serine hydrolase domain-containing protein n=1 Tax=Kordia jejudonensis TaxID=1348245 RepID=UPI000629A23C|nr:serine hydrolase domain-containing protein [Kordia jejudonensis]
MKKYWKTILGLKLVILILMVFGCSELETHTHRNVEKFTSEIQELKDYFQIPGLAVSIEKEGEIIYQNYLGFSDVANQTKLDSTVLFPIASITKVFSGVLIMKLVAQEKLSLDAPINTYLSEPIFEDSVLVKHVLSHTSQGKVGKEFYYSSRFGLLTQVIEHVSGKSFVEVMDEEIISPLKLKNTFLLKDSAQLSQEKRIVAKPYMLNNGIENGFIDFGYSTSAGIVSNLNDLAIFNTALDQNVLISQESKEKMFSSFNGNLPYGYGIFNQQFENIDIVWAYGQYDCYSSLLLKIPAENITLTVLANTNLLSDPARLIYGDASSSLFVMSFLKNYIFELDEMELFENPDEISKNDFSNQEFYRKKILAEALAESYMARFQPKKLQSSAKLLKKVFSQYPDYVAYADLNLLHNLIFLKDVAFYMELGEFNEFDAQIVQIGEKLLSETPENPYLHSYMGTYYDRKGDQVKARYHFESIVNAKNFSKNWYTQEAEDWLKNSQ